MPPSGTIFQWKLLAESRAREAPRGLSPAQRGCHRVPFSCTARSGLPITRDGREGLQQWTAARGAGVLKQRGQLRPQLPAPLPRLGENLYP